MIDLDDTYRRLAHPWSAEQLAAHYDDAYERGAEGLSPERDDLTRPIALLATVIPRAATMSVAIHMLHALPTGTGGTVARQLVDTAEKNAAGAIRGCHRALELDGAARDYSAQEWLPLVYDAAAPLLESARLDEVPPTVVQQTQEAISWLSRAVVELDRNSPELRPRSPTRSLACSRYGCSQTSPAISAVESGGCKPPGWLVPGSRALRDFVRVGAKYCAAVKPGLGATLSSLPCVSRCRRRVVLVRRLAGLRGGP